eukprot:CAMPEP_0201715224 /NCGR_PEP_ID=MMETSP0593-20130828/1456_1 /ASSEMBLY_ACC=CAM_ASM_000672 /TAXON_ID=267983 /ORGANISM="Skeletonema japonicum, Strain CCMP2506" /LENGTH=780 /DNA_ID=CAMNT_0048204663 /DNA_START=688 /DNA_END=3030 /DNA_ORIENTATION=-
MTSLSDADINMQENEFSSLGDVIADDGSVDVSLETSHGSRDANMESDVFRRGRWRRPLSDLWELLQVLLTTEGIMSSTHLWDYIPSEEMDISRSFVRHVQYNNQLVAKHHVTWEDYLCGCITSTFDGDKLTAVIILRIMDPSEFSTLVTPSGINTNIYPSMDTRPIGVIVCLRQHDINALLMTLFWKLDLRFLGTSSIKQQHIDVVIFVMIIIGGDLLSLHWLLLQLLAQHDDRNNDQLVTGITSTKIHVAWGVLLPSSFEPLKKMETLASSTSSFGVLQDVLSSDLSSDIITHKFQEIGRRIIPALGHHDNSEHIPNKVLFSTIARSVAELLFRYHPWYIQGSAFVGILRGMVSYLATALELLRYHKMMIGEYCPVKMRCYYYPVGEYLRDLSSPLSGYGLQGFASQFCSYDFRDIADGFYVVIACKLHLHHLSFVEITQDHRQHHILLHTDVTNHLFMDRHLNMITSKEYGETSSNWLHHAICPLEDTSLCKSYMLLGIATAEDTIRAQFGLGDEKLMVPGKDTISVSISSDTCALSIARYTSWIDGEPNIYTLHDLVNSDLLHNLVTCELCVGFNYGEHRKRIAIQELLDALHNFTCCRRINIGCSLGSSNIYRGNGSFVDSFASSAVHARNLFRPNSDEYAQLHDQLQHQVTDDRIHLEVQVKNDRPFANDYNALSPTFSMADLRLPSPKEEELLIQYTTSTGQINDNQVPIITGTNSYNNKCTTQVFFEISNYLLKWGAWNTVFVWLETLSKQMSNYGNIAVSWKKIGEREIRNW